MRLFGVVDGVVDRRDRSTFGFLAPFDAVLPAPAETPADSGTGPVYSYPWGAIPHHAFPQGSVPQGWPQSEWVNYVTIAGGVVVVAGWRPRQTWRTNRRTT